MFIKYDFKIENLTERHKVFILTEGSQKTGFGHITRCIAIYQAFEDKGIKPLFIVNGDNTISDFLNGLNYISIDWIENINKLINLLENNIVIIDSYKASKVIYETISSIAYKALYLDDNNRIEYPKGFVLNYAISANKINYPKNDNIIYLLGEKYILLRKEFWSLPEKNINKELKSILITFGGNDIRNLTPKILKLLCIEFPNINKNIIIGKGYKNIEEIKKNSDNNTNLFFNPNTKEIINIMLNSDIAISAGGQTIYELVVTGTPTIVISIAENQFENIKGLLSKNAINYIGYYQDKSIFENLLNEIHSLKNYEIRKEKYIINKNLIDCMGSKKIVEILS